MLLLLASVVTLACGNGREAGEPQSSARPPGAEIEAGTRVDAGAMAAPAESLREGEGSPSAEAPAEGAREQSREAGAAAGRPDRSGGSAGGSGPVAAPPQTSADAKEILRRASRAYEQVRSLRADFVQQLRNPLLGEEITSRGTLFQRRPDRLLLRFSDPQGDLILSDGTHFWLYYPSVDSQQVMRSPVGPEGAGAVDLQAQFLGDPTARFQSTLHGRESVRGRDAYALTLVPRQPSGYRSLRVWLDVRDHLARRFEIVEETGVVRRFELSDLEVNPSLPDDLFRFTPPAGARVIDRG